MQIVSGIEFSASDSLELLAVSKQHWNKNMEEKIFYGKEDKNKHEQIFNLQ